MSTSDPVVDEFDDDVDLGEDDAVRTFYPNVAQWVEQWLLPHYKRDLSARRWDPQWWEYTEVIARLEALWQAWEYQRTDGMTGTAIFFRDYLDPAMREITAADGPFWKLSDVRQRELPEQWAVEPAPAGLFRDADHPDEQ